MMRKQIFFLLIFVNYCLQISAMKTNINQQNNRDVDIIPAIKNDYNACSQELIHYAEQENKEMFLNIWNHHATIRDKTVGLSWSLSEDNVTLQHKMAFCKGNFKDKKGVIDKEALIKALHRLCTIDKDIPMVKQLLSKNNQEIGMSDNVLRPLCLLGDSEIVNRFLSARLTSFSIHKNPVDFQEICLDNSHILKINGTALHYAEKKELIEYLLKRKADVSCIDSEGQTPLHYAVIEGNIEKVKLLLQYGASTIIFDNQQKTPLHYACEKGDAIIFNLLLEQDKWRDLNGTILLISVLRCNHSQMHIALHIASILLKHGVDINTQSDWHAGTALHYFCKEMRKQNNLSKYHYAISFLLKNGADVNGLNKQGYTPFYYACEKECFRCWYDDIIKLCLEHGADLYTKGPHDKSPLNLLHETGFYKYIEEDLPVNARDWYGARTIVQDNCVIQ